MTTDLTVIVTAHNETLVSGPTMRSADAAIARAEADGFTVERIVALDAVTEACGAYFMQDAFSHWTRVHLDERDLGRTRNVMLPRTSGRYIAFLDSDDMFSENWLAEGIKVLNAAEAAGEKIIAHPELNWIFDGSNSVFAKPDQDSPIFSPYFFYVSNYYDSLCMTPRQCHLDHPYVHRDIPNGLSFQDWQFAIETMDAGWKHVAVEDTIIFKRRRESSLVTESRDRQAIVRAVPAMAVESVRSLGRPARAVSARES